MTDQRLESILAQLLRAGVTIAAAVVLAGGIWYLAVNGHATADYHHFRPAVHGLRSLPLLTGPEVLIRVGLLILVATPVARVVFSLVAFAMERDRVYVAMTFAVLAILMWSLRTIWM